MHADYPLAARGPWRPSVRSLPRGLTTAPFIALASPCMHALTTAPLPSLSPQVRVRAAALQTLQSLEPLELVKHVETAVRCLQDPSARVRIGAVDVMDKLLAWGRSSVAIGGHPLETTRETTLEATREATLETTLEATLETTHMLPSIKRYVPQLVHCLRDEDAIVRQRAISALLVSLEVPELVPYVEQV